jgi:hypothetical protein
MRRLWQVCFLSALLFILAPVLAAQAPADWDLVRQLVAGKEIRVSLSDGRKLRGEFRSATGEALMVGTTKSQEMLSRTMVTRVSVEGKSHRSRNALIGLGVGAGAGLIAGTIADHAPCQGIIAPFSVTLCGPPNAGKVVLTPVGALVGVIAGALIPARGWREVYSIK